MRCVSCALGLYFWDEIATLNPLFFDSLALSACDIFGLGISNPKLIADQLAKDTGYVVYVPDLLEGDYPNADKLSSVLVEKPMATESFLTRTMATFKMISGFMVHVGPGFLFRHRPSVTVALARQVR